jgi:hypothetical protein
VRPTHWKTLQQIDAVIQRLLPLLIARCLIQNRQHATNQHAKGIMGVSPFSTLTMCATLTGSIVRLQQPFMHAAV